MTDPALIRALGTLPAIRERLDAWVRCASVSADPAYSEGMERARRFIERRIAEAGFLNIRRLEAGGHAAVFAEWLDAPGRPTILVYGHYDVQPPDPLELWHAPPFEPTEREGRLYGRGVADDKGPCLVAVEALAALLAEEGRLPVNVKLLIEGEEELGSRTLERLLTEHCELLLADAVLSADGARWRPDLPTINVASRGIGGLEVTVRTAGKDLHSGRYGGVVQNALHVLADIVGSLHGPSGQVAVPGFYDGVAEPSMEERDELAAIPFDAADWLAPAGATEFGEAGYTTLERLWLRPCLDVNGLWGGYQGTGAKTVIPAEAHAKLSVRLVPGQDPTWIEKALRAHLLTACPDGVEIKVTSHTGWSSAHAVPPDHPLLLAAESALEETSGTRPLRVRIGASLPITDIMARVLGLDVVMFSFATADEDFHAPNEFFRLSAIPEGLTAWISLLRRLSDHSQDDYSGFRGGCEATSN